MTLRIAIAGAGAIGRTHAELVAASSECTLVGLADPAPAAAALAQRFGVPLFDALATLLAGSRPDGVILATPTPLHAAGALSCLAAGVPVLIEKPLAHSVADAQRVVDAARHSGVPVLVGHHRRHSAHIAAARALIASGRLGRLVAVNGSATFVKPDSYYSQGPWRAQPGGGPILINLVHEIDSLRALVGEIVAVQAFASNAVRGLAVEDSAVVNLRFASGALGSFVLSDTAASPHSWEQNSGENPGYDHHADQDCYVIAGTQGSLQLPTMQVFEYLGQRSWSLPLARSSVPVTAVDPLARQLAHFCAVLRRETEPLVTAEDALHSLIATLAVAEAARSGAVVELVPVPRSRERRLAQECPERPNPEESHP